MPSQREIAARLVTAGVAEEGSRLEYCAGGDTHQNFKIVPTGALAGCFVKVNTGKHGRVLESEYYSLQRLQELFPSVYPRPITLLIEQDLTILVMELLALATIPGDQSAELGRLLARQHGVQGDFFGWPQDNHIGLSEQRNEPCESWPIFFWERRIAPQLDSARDNGLPEALVNQIRDSRAPLQDALGAAQIAPALLHGDLWGGNVGYNVTSQRPCLFDPAPYYGDPEADLAMTRLFGSFSPEFYAAYDESGLRRPDYERREAIYNLYHALNHFNLFGSGYLTLVSEKTRLMRSHLSSTKLF